MKYFDKFSNAIRLAEGLFEIAVLSTVFYFLWLFVYDVSFTQTLRGRGAYLLMAVYAVIIYFVFNMTDSFKFGHLKISVIGVSQCIGMFIANVVSYMVLCLMANRMVEILPMLFLTVVDWFICIFLTYWYSAIYHRCHSPRKMLMIYDNDNAIDILDKLNARPDKYSVSTRIKSSVGIEKLKKEIDKYDAILINDVSAKTRNTLVKYCYTKGIRTYIVPKISDIIIGNSEPINLFDTPVKYIDAEPLSPEQRFVKRLLDIVLSLLAIVISSPVMFITALCIKLEDGGPVFFRQDRVTKDEKVFNILKFRSMVVDAEKQGYSLDLRAKDKDPRITKVGSFIRACRIDELPQLFNILKGDMSIVGPRPERVENHNAYKELVPEWILRTKVKGGLTGYAQIYGKYNTTPYDKVRLDLEYIEGYSLMLDLKMMFMTLQVLTKKESTEGFK